MIYRIGQRWISYTESQLGLGIIKGAIARQIEIYFPAVDEDRIYSIENAPLSRIYFEIGDTVPLVDEGSLHIDAITEEDGLIFYQGTNKNGEFEKVCETRLHAVIHLNTPSQRLLSGLIDRQDSFKLRIETLKQMSRLQQSKARGLIGARVNHLPHQVYIASTVAKRYAPRVLLADEVGLGKTIEAGMIIHYQLQTNRAQKVLILVPQSLIHQWLVEMLRRFNLLFSIIDAERYAQKDLVESELEDEELLEDKTCANPFDTENLILCSLDFLMENPEAHRHALETQWDLVVVDEAHHLHWSESNANNDYQFVSSLAQQSKGLLLLTATPEQAGVESHFARLRLLDPARFYDLDVFLQEEAHYQKVNQLIEELMSFHEAHQDEPLSRELHQKLYDLIGPNIKDSLEDNLQCLLDRHGTGRVLFRNTRAAIKGFPKRQVHAYPLSNPTVYASLAQLNSLNPLYPELALLENGFWLQQDPRVEWLIDKINELFPQKVLIICANSQTAISLEQHLKLKGGIASTAFHEHLSIIERDRAAEYFAESAKAMVCSEIGSEGRNFQFAHHLVLFDLPQNPDLLEQRIGRLDRIGQEHTIEIHVPYIEGSAQEVLFRWYHEGINLFQQSTSVGYTIYQTFESELNELLLPSAKPAEHALTTLIQQTKAFTADIQEKLAEGRDRLLEMNSCNLPVAQALIEEIEAEENILEIENYMTSVFQEFGIEQEYHSDKIEILKPTEHMKVSHLTGFKEEGTTITFARQKALIREDIEFLSFEHPMVQESIEIIINSDLGNNTVVTMSVKNIAHGTVFIEAFYTINCAAPKQLQLDRFVPLTPIRVFLEMSGKDLTKVLDFNQLNALCQPMKKPMATAVVKGIRQIIESLLIQCSSTAEEKKSEYLNVAHEKMQEQLNYELNLLKDLQKLNPTIRDEEITYLSNQIAMSSDAINHASLYLQGVRIVVNKI